MRDPGDFDAGAYVLGTFSELFDAVAAVSREITSAAQTAPKQGFGRLVAHSHSIVNVATAEQEQYLASVIVCFDADPADAGGELVGTVLDLGPFASVRAATDAVSGEVAMGCYLMYERERLAFAGISHSVSGETDARGNDQFFVTVAVTYRGADPSLGPLIEPPAVTAAHHPSPPRRKLRVRFGGNKDRRAAHYRQNSH